MDSRRLWRHWCYPWRSWMEFWRRNQSSYAVRAVPNLFCCTVLSTAVFCWTYYLSKDSGLLEKASAASNRTVASKNIFQVVLANVLGFTCQILDRNPIKVEEKMTLYGCHTNRWTEFHSHQFHRRLLQVTPCHQHWYPTPTFLWTFVIGRVFMHGFVAELFPS